MSGCPQEIEGVLVSIDVERWTTELRLTAEGTSVCLTFDEDGAPESHLC